MLTALVLACGACASGSAPAGVPSDAAQPASSPDVERLLDHSRIESIVNARGPAFTRQVALLAGDLSDAELERLVPAVSTGFASDLMRRDVARFLESEDPAGYVGEVLTWHEGGATAELIRLSDVYEPPLSVEAYAQTLASDPPDQERVRLIADWAESQGAGGFYILVEEALTEAAHAVWAEFRPEAPAFAPMSGDALFARLDASQSAAIVRFLHRYETIPGDLVRAAMEEYRSEAGRWYVETYSLGVAEAIRAAGHRVVAELGRTSTR